MSFLGVEDEDEVLGALYRDRADAGRLLGAALAPRYGEADALVLALPRGGVPVAYEVALALDAPLDVIVVRKLGVPGQGELAMGAIASGGARVLNRDVVASLGISSQAIAVEEERQRRELRRREQSYRGDRLDPPLAGRTVLLIDDGIATGATMRAAVQAVRQRGPGRVVVAVPVASRESVEELQVEVDDVVALATPAGFMAVGQYYAAFGQTSDDEVRTLLDRAWRRLASNRQP